MLAVASTLAALAAPEQIHIAYADNQAMWVSWLDQQQYNGSVAVKGGKRYVSNPAKTYDFQARGQPAVYTSPYIYHTLVDGLDCGATYTYQVCGTSCREEISFKTPKCLGKDVPTVMGVVGDLGQTGNSDDTINHMLLGDYDYAVLVGDLSYADAQNYASCIWGRDQCRPERWDSWGRQFETLASKVAVQTLPGNHELEYEIRPVIGEEFLAFNSRMKGVATSAPNGPRYWSFSSGNVHVIALNSYEPFAKGSTMYNFLETELSKVDRSVTPWLLVSLHAPWYNSNKHHQHEKEEDLMRADMEALIHRYNVDVMYAGHVHAYERTYNVFNGVRDETGFIHITIGDGGNRENLEENCWIDPQPDWSAHRQRAFGHGRFESVNATHAMWSWHQQGKEYKTISDSVYLVKKTPTTVEAVVSEVQFEFAH